MSFDLQKYYKILPYLVIVIGLSLSIFAGWFTYKYYDVENKSRLEMASNEIVHLVQSRMATYEQVLRSGVALFNASILVTRDEWEIFTKEQNLNKNFKGIQGFGYSEVVLPKSKQDHEERIKKEGFANFKIHPEGQRELYTSIIYLEPFDDRNKRAFGYDMFSEKIRREAMTKAMQSGEATLSGKITLVQEYDKDIQAGFLMYLPVYKKGAKLDTPQDRTLAIKGFVYAPFRVNDLMDGILGTIFSNTDFEIYNGYFSSKENLLYDSDTNHHDKTLYKPVQLTMNNHNWLLTFKTHSTLVKENIYIIFLIPSLILILTLLLYLLLNSLIKTEEKAVKIATKATKMLHASEERLRFALEGTGDGLWDFDLKTNEVYFSKRYKELLGFEEDEMFDTVHEWKSRIHPDDSEQETADAIAHIEGKNDSYSSEHRVKCKDGSYKWILSRGIIVSRDIDGSPLRMVGSNSDISERKEMEKEFKVQEEMMLTQSKQAAMGDMIAMIAHQWRQPLAVISMNLMELQISIDLGRDITTDFLLNHENELSKQVQQLSNTIDDFRNFFKPSKQNEHTTIEDSLNTIINIIGSSLTNSNIRLNIQNNSKRSLLINKSSLIQVLLNFIGNAKDILLEKEVSEATININVNETKETITISICDNGGGIPESIIDKVCQPYLTTKGSLNGTGLGLHISKTIIEKHLFGSLKWHNEDEGACFLITLKIQ